MTMRPSSFAGLSFSFALSLILLLATTDAAVPCNSTHNPCEELLFKGSQCKNGYCTNPFEGGCLKSMLQEEEYAKAYGGDSAESILRRRLLSVQRVCNSEDSNSSPFCQPADSSYTEVRIFGQNWESSIATSWVMQIILSEVLNVPATLETGVLGQNNNFYNQELSMDYGVSAYDDEYASFQNAFDAENGDCTLTKKDGEYVPCAHVLLELWKSSQFLEDKKNMGVTEPVYSFTGGSGTEGWYITKFSIERDPSLDFYSGYQGNENRKKLARTFKRPTTWKDYCTLISATNCSTKDDIAHRAPAKDGSEDGRYFVEGNYTGYFRATDKNNCTKTKECTGHFMNYPCDWTSHFLQQAHHLGIALESEGKNDPNGGYAYSEMVEIWRAANATKSDMIGHWFLPDATFTSFIGTESELSQVSLPAATQACYKARSSGNRCDADLTFLEKYGVKEGSCGVKPIGFRKVVVGNMESIMKQNRNLRTAMSPAYTLIDNFQLAPLQLDDLMLAWTSRKIDPYNFDLRFATCKWMADNLEYITNLIPRSHPRIFVETSYQAAPITICSIIISAFASAAAVGAALLISGIQSESLSARRFTFRSRVDASSITFRKNSQIEFVYLLLIGLFFLPVGALLLALKPSRGTCISSVWLINVGYTLVLVPTLVRVSAIIKVLQAGKKFRRVKVDKKKLLRTSLGISAIAAVFCAIWTGVDPMTVQEELSVADEPNDLGETVAWVSYYCESESNVWLLIFFVWQGLLLVGGSVLAFQIRSAPPIVNDSRELAFMIYSSTIFLILRIIVYNLEGSTLSSVYSQKARSLLWGLDAFVNICIYFTKFFQKFENGGSLVVKTSTTNRDAQSAGLHQSSHDEYEEEKVEEGGTTHENGGSLVMTISTNRDAQATGLRRSARNDCEEEKVEEGETTPQLSTRSWESKDDNPADGHLRSHLCTKCAKSHEIFLLMCGTTNKRSQDR